MLLLNLDELMIWAREGGGVLNPERDRDRDALSLPFELPAPRKRRPRNTIEQDGRYRRLLSQPDPSADDSDTVPIESS